MTTITLGFGIPGSSEVEGEPNTTSEAMVCEVFRQALRTILDYPLSSQIKRLRIKFVLASSNNGRLQRMVDNVKRLFRTLGPLDELTIDFCCLKIFLPTLFKLPQSSSAGKPVVFPHVRALTLRHLFWMFDEMEAMAELAKSQHRLGIPFERVVFRDSVVPLEAMAEKLRPWISEVDCVWQR